jgi:hypothetical protein
LWSQSSLGKSRRLSETQTAKQKGLGMTQVVEHLPPSMKSKFSLHKKKKKKKTNHTRSGIYQEKGAVDHSSAQSINTYMSGIEFLLDRQRQIRCVQRLVRKTCSKKASEINKC